MSPFSNTAYLPANCNDYTFCLTFSSFESLMMVWSMYLCEHKLPLDYPICGSGRWDHVFGVYYPRVGLKYPTLVRFLAIRKRKIMWTWINNNWLNFELSLLLSHTQAQILHVGYFVYLFLNNWEKILRYSYLFLFSIWQDFFLKKKIKKLISY